MHSLEERSWNTGCLSKIADFLHSSTCPRLYSRGCCVDIQCQWTFERLKRVTHTSARRTRGPEPEIGNASRDELRQLESADSASIYSKRQEMARSFDEECNYLEKISSCCYRIKKGFVPNMKVSPTLSAVALLSSPGSACVVGGRTVLCERCLADAHV